MSTRGDRSLPGRGNLLAAAIVLALLGVSGLVFWWKMAGRTPTKPAAGQNTEVTAPVPPREETVPTTVYLASGGKIAAASVPVKRQIEAQALSREVVLAVLAAKQQVRGEVLSSVQFRELYLDAAGTAYVDLSVIPRDGIRTSAWEELLAVYSLVNSLTQNVEEVKRVHFLLDGKEAQTLAGHVDLSRTYTKRMDLVKQ